MVLSQSDADIYFLTKYELEISNSISISNSEVDTEHVTALSPNVVSMGVNSNLQLTETNYIGVENVIGGEVGIAEVLIEKIVEANGNNIDISSSEISVEVNRPRKLFDMDNYPLSEFDNSTLPEVDYITY